MISKARYHRFTALQQLTDSVKPESKEGTFFFSSCKTVSEKQPKFHYGTFTLLKFI